MAMDNPTSGNEAELSRAMRTIAGWFGCADEANGKTANELGRFLYKRQGEIRDFVVKICREGWQQRAQVAEAERDKALAFAQHRKGCRSLRAWTADPDDRIVPAQCDCGLERLRKEAKD